MASGKEMIKKDLDKLTDLGVTYFSINLGYTKDKDGRIKKHPQPNTILKYQNKEVKTTYNDKYNASMIPLGKPYNLIGIDVDNKDNTVQEYFKILKKENYEKTLTVKTINNGYHFYYTLNKKQAKKLEELDFKAKNDALYGLHIDVKYTNQVFFGPSYLDVDNKLYFYKVIKSKNLAELPDFIYQELLRNITTLPPIKQISTMEISKGVELEFEFLEDEEPKGELINNGSGEDARLSIYLDCLSQKYYDNYDLWFKIGSIIYNEKGSFELFDKFSQRSEKYDAKSCKDKWQEYKKNKGKTMTIASLLKFAKESNPAKYAEAQTTDKNNILQNIIFLGPTDKDVANLFFLDNQDNYLYDQLNDTLYSLNEKNIWLPDKKHHDIHDEINKFFLPLIQPVYEKTIKNYDISDIIQIPKKELTEDQKLKIKQHNILKKNFSDTCKYIKTNSSKRGITNELLLMYKKRGIFEQMDNVNNYLFSFRNGVMDLKTGEFRLAKPEELITFSVNYDYSEERDEETIEDIMKIFRETHETQEDLDYLLTTIAQCLSGEPSLEKFYLWKGNGRNGKGVKRDFIQYTFGPYYDPLDIEYLNKTKFTNAKGPDDTIARKKNCRIVMTTEPDSSMEIQTNKILQWSGRDPIQCRTLQEKNFNYIPKFKLFLQSNYDISFGGSNVKAMTARLEVKDFPYSFVENPTLENEKPLDVNLKERISQEKYKLAFFHILHDYYKIFIKNGKKIKMPQSVRETTKIYLGQSDPFTAFFDEIVIKTSNEKDTVKNTDLYKAFSKFNSGNNVSLNRNEFYAAMSNKGIKISNLHGYNIYRNIKLNLEKLNNRKDLNIDFLDD